MNYFVDESDKNH